MATIIQHIISRKKYILLGSSHGMYQSERPSALGGTWAPSKEQDEFLSVCCCDKRGKICWFDSEDVEVVMVDNQHPLDILSNL